MSRSNEADLSGVGCLTASEVQEPSLPANPLEVPELLEIILDHVGHRYAIHYMVVCRMWADVGMRVLWGSPIARFDDILRLLGPVIYWTDNKSARRSPQMYELAENSLHVTASQWSRFLRYTHLVRSLKFDSRYQSAPSNFDVLSDLVSLRGGNLFPRARSLTVMTEDILPCLERYWSSLLSLSNLQVFHFSHNIVHLVDKLFGAMAKTCPNLRDITSLGSTMTTSTLILPFLEYDKWPNLTQLNTRPIRLTPATIATLSRCHKLRKIQATLIDEADQAVLENVTKFTALEELDIVVDFDEPGVLQTLAFLTTDALRHLQIETADRVDKFNLPALMPTACLQLLEAIVSHSPRLEAFRILGNQVIGFHELAPISRLAHLNHLTVQLSCLNEQDLEESTWMDNLPPTLRRLFIQLRREPCITMQGVVRLAQACPYLHYCHLSPVMVGDFHPLERDQPTFSPELRYFDIRLRGVSDVNVNDIARSLHSMLPITTRVDLVGGPWILIEQFNTLRDTQR